MSYKLAKASSPDDIFLTKESFSFVLGAGKVIKGFEEAIRSMKVGQKVTATIKSELAYGKLGQPPEILNDEDLIFEIHLLGCKDVSLDSLGILSDSSKIQKSNEVKAAANEAFKSAKFDQALTLYKEAAGYMAKLGQYTQESQNLRKVLL